MTPSQYKRLGHRISKATVKIQTVRDDCDQHRHLSNKLDQAMQLLDSVGSELISRGYDPEDYLDS